MSDLDNELEEAAGRIDKEEGRGSLGLWFGVLGSPLAWAAQLGTNYSAEEWFACSSSTEHAGQILGLDVRAATAIVTTVTALVALASLLVARSCYRKVKVSDECSERARWMAFAGIVEGGLFLGMILLGYLPSLAIDPCELTP